MAAKVAELTFFVLWAPFPEVFLYFVPDVLSVDDACGCLDARVTHSMQKLNMSLLRCSGLTGGGFSVKSTEQIGVGKSDVGLDVVSI